MKKTQKGVGGCTSEEFVLFENFQLPLVPNLGKMPPVPISSVLPKLNHKLQI